MTVSGARLAAVLADITTREVDAIVNAANERLAPGGGVCGAIFRAAGPELIGACRRQSPCATGAARITPGFLLRTKYVIHAVGPVWHGGGQGEEGLLAAAYRSALLIADGYGCRSIAFPALSTGIFGFPLQAATAIAVKTARGYIAAGSAIGQILFACFSEETLGAYRAFDVPGTGPGLREFTGPA